MIEKELKRMSKHRTHRWSGGRAELRRGQWSGGEKFVSEIGVCAREEMGANDAEVDTQGSGLCEDVADLEFELGVESSTAEAEVILIDFIAHALRSCKKTVVKRAASAIGKVQTTSSL